MDVVDADLLGEFDPSEWAGIIDWIGEHTREGWPIS